MRDAGNEDVVTTFSDMHLPRGVGEAIESAYEGDLDIHCTEQAGIVGSAGSADRGQPRRGDPCSMDCRRSAFCAA